MIFKQIQGFTMNSLSTENVIQLSQKLIDLIEQSRNQVIRQVNCTMVQTYYEIGRLIVENEQKGKIRAEYGKKVLQELS